MEFPRSEDQPRDRKIRFWGPGPEESKDSLSKDGPAQVGVKMWLLKFERVRNRRVKRVKIHTISIGRYRIPQCIFNRVLRAV